ncbi:DUF4249 family protein [Salibacteraceae bacterium]|nr:DUF4249 family protein [Salibacteraceae bacterium]
MNTKIFKSVLKKALIAIMFLASFSACKNELKVNTDGEAQAIIYGVLDPYDSVQVFRVTKSFSGEGDPQSYAKNPDSNYFNEVDLVLVESLFGNEVRRMNLIKTEITNKDAGEFFGPNQIIYNAYPSKNPGEPMYLNPEADFRLEGTVDGKSVGGSFSIVKENPAIPFFFYSSNKFQRFWGRSLTLINGSKVNDLTFDLTFPRGTKVGGIKLLFTYEEFYEGETEAVVKVLEFELGEKIFDNAQDPKPTEIKFTGRSFYERIAAIIPDAAETPNLLYRKAGPVDFKMIAVSEDLFYYRQVKNSSEGIAQDRPEYTNVENGFGVLAGRQIVTMNQQLVAHGNPATEVLLSKFSDDELATGVILGLTGAKGFCSDPSHNLGSSCR